MLGKRALQQWTDIKENLTRRIETHADALIDVDQVVCFGLGTLNWRRSNTFVQHLAAVTIRDTLQNIQSKQGIHREIPIIVQDPAYCAHCKHVLENQLGIRAVTDFSCFSKVTKNSFVVSVAPSAPVCHIIANLTLDEGGPAGMLCDMFKDNYLARDVEVKGEPAVKGEHTATGFTSDEPTKNMVEYKKRCVVHDISDAAGVLGMEYRELEGKFWLQADLNKAWIKEGKYFQERKNVTEADQELYEGCKSLWQLEGLVCFRDSALLIRSN